MADKNDVMALAVPPQNLVMDFGHQRAGGIQRKQRLVLSLAHHGL